MPLRAAFTIVAVGVATSWIAAVSAADCNGNSVADTMDIEGERSDDCNENLIPDECEFAPIAFGPAAFDRDGGFPVGRIPRVAVAADFNGDGRMDLATGNQDSDSRSTSTITLLLGGGDGTFAPAVKLDAGRSLSFMIGRDLDGDGDPDLATANWNMVLVRENQGDGSFGAATKITVPSGTRTVIAADVTADGLLDLVTANTRDDNVSVLENQGDGSFGPPVPVGVGRSPTSIAAADLDADGDVDLAVASPGSGAVSVHYGSGDGTFNESTIHPAGGDAPFALLAVDLDGDGHPDLAVATHTGISVLFNDGTGKLGAPVLHSGLPSSLASTDLEDDGDIDLVFGSASSDQVSVLVNDGRGRFGAMSLWVPGVRSAISAADLDGDGDADVAVNIVNPDRMVILWQGRESDGTLSLGSPATFPAGGDPHTAALGDLDGDGDLDLITGLNNEGISALTNLGDGTFAPPRRLPGGNSFSVAAADLDGDGDVDLASAEHGPDRVQILQNGGDGTFRRGEDYHVAGRPFHIAYGDLDRDGQIDLITANQSSNTVSVLFNSGSGKFGRLESLPVGSVPVAVAVSDLDGDRDLDIASCNHGSSDVSIIENRGNGRFSDAIHYPTTESPSFVAAGDLDLDGHVELVTVGKSMASVFWNLGEGSFELPAPIFIYDDPHSVTVADVNGDGWPDLIAADERNDSVSILVNHGDRSFSDPARYPVGSQPRFVVTGDLDGDDVLDLVSANHGSADVTVFLNRSYLSVDYLKSICTERDFHEISNTSGGGLSRERVTKYALPSRRDTTLLPPLFQNVRRYPLHEEFLRTVLPERSGPLTPDEYKRLVGRRESRDYYVGTLTRVAVDRGFLYAFSVVADTGFHPGEVLRLEEVQWVYESLKTTVGLRPLYYHPDTELAQREVENRWPDASPVPIYFGDRTSGRQYEAYSLGTAYGRVRLLTLEEFEERGRRGGLTFRDIPVVDQSPRDIDGVVAGLITAAPQGTLSHTAIRLGRRGTPNAFVPDARNEFGRHDGKLVRLEICDAGYTIDDQVTVAEAEEFWDASRPPPPGLPPFDAEYRTLDHLFEMDLSAGDGVPAEARFGGKAANFARLQRTLTDDLRKHREPGFAIPMHYYVEFLRGNSIAVDGLELTYEEYLRKLIASPEFQSDPTIRSEELRTFRSLARRNGAVHPHLVTRVAERISAVFGSSESMVRFRSSSNVEDALEFNGAGLYESTSVCAADTLDPWARDASYCDPTRTDERTIERALKKVWTSLWTFRAYEERSYFQIPQDSAAMGILVTRTFLAETANGVAFTGNPRDPSDRRYVITVQRGEESVVSPEPGVTVERNLLEVEDGEVEEIVRDRSSSLLAPGETVLSDDQLKELARFMWSVNETFPLELEGHLRDRVLLDFEFKIEPDGSLAVKQVRPFLLPAPDFRSPRFELEIPAGTMVCGVFSKEHTGREPREEYETKSTVRFIGGAHELRADSATFPIDLIEEVRFGPRQDLATPLGPGLVETVRLPTGCKETTYRFNFEQRFALPGGDSLEIRIFGLEFRGQEERAVERTLVLDEEFLTFDLSMQGVLSGEPVVRYSSCSQDLLPRWQLDVDLDGGSSMRLEERFLPSENDISTGPANLIRADVVLEGMSRTVTDYWQLVYTSHRHNRHARYWVVFEPPLEVTGVDDPVHVMELALPESGARARVVYRGESFEELATSAVRSLARERLEDGEPVRFRRGDVTMDGTVDISDAIDLLEFLFRRGRAPGCEKAADVDDNGRLNVSDAVAMLVHLYGGRGAPLDSLPECGVDTTPDGLTCENSGDCP